MVSPSPMFHDLGRFSLFLFVLLVAPAGDAQVVMFSDEATWQGTLTSSALVDFDTLSDGETVGGQYPGITFSAFEAGFPRATSCLSFHVSPPHSLSSNSTACNLGGGGFAMDFDPPVTALGFWIGDLEFEGSVIELLDAQGLVIHTIDLLNLPQSPCPCPLVWAFSGFVSSTPIVRAQQSIGAADAVWFDDFTFGFGVAGTFLRGDANGDGRVSGLIDGLFLLNFGFVPGSPQPPCMSAADADDSGSFSGLVDGLFILNYWFVPGSSPPPPPGPTDCGPDPTNDSLECESPSCP